MAIAWTPPKPEWIRPLPQNEWRDWVCSFVQDWKHLVTTPCSDAGMARYRVPLTFVLGDAHYRGPRQFCDAHYAEFLHPLNIREDVNI